MMRLLRPTPSRRLRRATTLAVALLAASALLPAARGVLAGSLPDLTLTKKASAATVASGANVTFTITVSNLGPGTAWGVIYVGDQLPAGLTYVGAAGTGWSCANSGQNVACQSAVSVTPLAAGAAAPPITVTAAVAPGAPSQIRNCAVVGDGNTTMTPSDANPANQQGCAEIRVTAPVPGQLCATKFEDLDGDRQKSGSEPFLADWVFTYTPASGGPSGTITTGASGRTCTDVPSGPYRVSEALVPGWRQTRPAIPGPQTVTVPPGGLVVVTFGNIHERCCLDFNFAAGKKDNFSTADGLMAEPTVGIYPPAVVFPHASLPDEQTAFTDLALGPQVFESRLSLPTGGCLASARYEIAVKPVPFDPGGSQIALHIPGTGGALWKKPLSVLAPGGVAPSRTFVWDLAAMPAGGANLLAALNARRTLDTFTNPGLAVDYIRLTVTYCECPPASPK